MSLPAQRSLSLGLHAHNNRGLFADHYLDHPERLHALQEWQQTEGVEESFQQIAQLYAQHAARFNSRTNEPQTEHDFIQPVLNLLWREQRAGDCYQVQVTIPNVDVRRQPDYAFFRTAQERRDADGRKGSLDYWRDVPCLGDAKKWSASLDKERGADENPTAQICNYLYRSRVRWGILTNGRIWRLYEREKSSAGGIYYEVNLEELLKSDVLVYDSFERTHTISHDTASAAFEMPQQKWMNREGAAITLFEDKEGNTFERIRSQSAPLEKYCEFCLGLTPYDKYSGHTEDQIRNKVFHAKSQIDSTYKKLLVSGDVRRYEVEWNREEWIKYGEWLAAPREQRFFTQERILVQQIVDWSSLRLFAGWTDEELYNTQNQFNLLPRKGTNLKFILAILNSRLMSCYHRKVFLDVALQRFQKVLIKDAKTSPIPRIPFTTPSDERARLVEEGKRLCDKMMEGMTKGAK